MVIINTDGIVLDSTNPDLTLSDVSGWKTTDINVGVTVSDNLAGVKEVNYTTDEAIPQTGTIAMTNGAGTITLINSGEYTLSVTATDNSGNIITKTSNIKLDKVSPTINVTGNPIIPVQSADLIIAATAGVSGKTITVAKDGGSAQVVAGTSYTVAENGTYKFTVTNGANISAEQTVVVDKIDKAKPVLSINSNGYTNGSWSKDDVTLNVINTTGNLGTTKLEYSLNNGGWTTFNGNITVSAESVNNYQFRGTSASGVKSDIKGFTAKIDKTAPIISGASDSSSYYIAKKIKIIDNLGEIAEATYNNGIDTETTFNDGYQVNKAGKYTLTVRDKAGNSATLSFEIKALPKVEEVEYTTEYKVLIDSIRAEFNEDTELDKAEKTDIDNQIKALEDRYYQLEEIKKQKDENLKQIHENTNDVTVTGIDGTTFASNVYLVVTPLKNDNSKEKYNNAFNRVKIVSDNSSNLKGKELVALYDVSLFRDNIKVQPDGKVKVKIKIPEELRNRTGFDIVHIADDGTVTIMNAIEEDGYLVFTTTHFSEYAIVAKTITNEKPVTAKTGDNNSLVLYSIILSLSGIFILRRRNRKGKITQ